MRNNPRVRIGATTALVLLLALTGLDNLFIMGPAIVAAAAIWQVARGVRRRLAAFAAAALAITLLTPLVRTSTLVDALPGEVQAYRARGLDDGTPKDIWQDVIASYLALADADAALALLRFAAANGFFWAAIGGLMRIFVSDYLRLKKTVGLSHYTATAMLAKLRAAGYAATRAPLNIGHNQWRMTFRARLA